MLLKRYRELLREDVAKAAEFISREYVSFQTTNEGELFNASELEALKEFGASLRSLNEFEWQEGEIKRAMKGFLC